jgi:hypothetical protein
MKTDRFSLPALREEAESATNSSPLGIEIV